MDKQLLDAINREAEKHGGNNEVAILSYKIGAKYGYSLASPEIEELKKENERLKGLVLRIYNHYYPENLEQFKSKYNL